MRMNENGLSIESDKSQDEDLRIAQQPQKYKSFKFIFLRVISVTIGSYTFGYSWAVYNQLFHSVKKVYNWPEKYENWISGGINSVFIFVAIFGCLYFSTMKKFSRLNVFQVFDVLAIIGSCCLFFVNNYLFVAGRVIQGFVAGANSVLVPLFIREFVPIELYSKISVIITLGIVFGQVSAFLMGAPIDSISYKGYWRICLLPCVLLPLVRIYLVRRWMYDTPVYYILNQQYDIAKSAMKEIYYGRYVEERFLIEKSAVEGREEEENTQESAWQLLQKTPNLKLVFLGGFLFLNQQFCGINAVNFYSTRVFEELGNKTFSTYMTALWGIMDIISVSISLICIVENFNRKTLWTAGTIALGVMLCIIGYISKTDSKIFALVCFFIYITAFNFTLGPLTWTLVAEMSHSKLINLPVASHWIFAFCIAQFFPVVIQKEYLGLQNTFYAFGILTFFNGFLMHFWLKETKGKSKDEIRRQYRSPSESDSDEDIVNLKKSPSSEFIL